MREVEAADAGARPHRERLGQQHAGLLLDVEQPPEGSLLGVIGAGGVAGRRTDAAVLLLDELLLGEILAMAVAPDVAHHLVQVLGEGLGEPIGQRLGHDGVVVVVLRRESARTPP